MRVIKEVVKIYLRVNVYLLFIYILIDAYKKAARRLYNKFPCGFCALRYKIF